MHGMPLAEPAILLGLHPVGMSLLILCSIIVTVLALSAGQCDSRAHAIPPLILVMIVPSGSHLPSGAAGFTGKKIRPQTHPARLI